MGMPMAHLTIIVMMLGSAIAASLLWPNPKELMQRNEV